MLVIVGIQPLVWAQIRDGDLGINTGISLELWSGVAVYVVTRALVFTVDHQRRAHPPQSDDKRW